jgi:hypothetical protein
MNCEKCTNIVAEGERYCIRCNPENFKECLTCGK